MSAATVTMTPSRAQALRKARDDDARKLIRMTKKDLAVLWTSELGVIYGTASKDEMVGELLNHRHPAADRDEAAHVLHHGDAVWPDCPWCTGSAA